MSATKEILTLARFHQSRENLRKSSKPAAQLTLAKDAKPQPKPASSMPGDLVRVQRPGMHQAPIVASLVSTGRHGIVARDSSGRHIKVRHEHVVDMRPMTTARDRAEYASELAAAGVEVPIEARFLKLSPKGSADRRSTESQRALMEVLASSHGVPLDMERISEHASYDEAEELLARYVTDDAGRIGTTRK